MLLHVDRTMAVTPTAPMVIAGVLLIVLTAMISVIKGGKDDVVMEADAMREGNVEMIMTDTNVMMIVGDTVMMEHAAVMMVLGNALRKTKKF